MASKATGFRPQASGTADRPGANLLKPEVLSLKPEASVLLDRGPDETYDP
jgi:hypothetical protein